MKDKILEYFKKSGIKDAEIFVSENEKFGHYSTNVALKLGKKKGRSPMKVAEEIVASINSSASKRFFRKIEIVAPGFINFWISEEALQGELRTILQKKNIYGKISKINAAKRGGQVTSRIKTVNIEFISANPTGPLTIGNGRGGFFGDTLANILKFSGFKVTKEYYINDAKNSAQIKELGKTGVDEGKTYLTNELEAVKYKLRRKIANIVKKFSGKPKEGVYGEVGNLLAQEINKRNKKIIEKVLKIKFDNWFSEESLYKNRAVDKILAELRKKKLVYSKDKALWFKTKQFGDSEDRVLIRSTGEPTYILPDLAYHWDKFKKRKFDKTINVWGADHHGYIPRLRAGLKAFGISEDRLTIIITQLVRLIKNGQEYRMSKRKGDYVTMEDLIKEVGVDAARFFFLMSAPDTHMNFDLDLAKERSIKNPVYYVQYAAVRCASILRKSPAKGKKSKINFALLNTKEDIGLMRQLVRFPEIVEEAAQSYNPQVLIRYSINLARQFHNFYEKERIVGGEPALMNVRLELIRATKIVFENLFGILGISYPKKM